MRIDRETYQGYFSGYWIPLWDCPTCKKGKIEIDFADIKIYETNESKKNRGGHEWGEDLSIIVKYFSGKMQCNNRWCGEIFAISGEITVVDNDIEVAPPYDRYYPKYIFPTLHFFELTDDIPYDIEDALKNAFKLFWTDNSACANAIRITIDEILNDKRILKTKLLKSKKRIKLTLHERIELFKKKNTEIANHLMAVKWIGNAGTHSEDIDTEDLLDGFDLLKYSLEKLYTSHDKEIAQLTKKINQRRKP